MYLLSCTRLAMATLGVLLASQLVWIDSALAHGGGGFKVGRLPGHHKGSIQQPPPPQNAGNVNVRDFGAQGDGATDDSGAIQQAIAAAQASGKGVYFPPGNYLHNSLITDNGVGLIGAGGATVLTAGDPFNSAVVLTGISPSIQNLVVSTGSLGSGSTPNPNTATVYVKSSQGFVVQGITVVQGFQRWGVYVQQSAVGAVKSVSLNATGNSADNGVVVDGCSNVSVISNLLNNEGTAIWVQGLSGTSSQSIAVIGNTINSAVAVGISANHVNTLDIEQNSVSSNNIAIAIQDNSNFSVSQNSTSGGLVGMQVVTFNPPNTGTISQNQIRNCQNQGMSFVNASATPSNIQIASNQFGECGIAGGGIAPAVISCVGNASPSSFSFLNNIYAGHQNLLLDYIFSDAHINIVSGNTQTQTSLPNVIP